MNEDSSQVSYEAKTYLCTSTIISSKQTSQRSYRL